MGSSEFHQDQHQDPVRHLPVGQRNSLFPRHALQRWRVEQHQSHIFIMIHHKKGKAPKFQSSRISLKCQKLTLLHAVLHFVDRKLLKPPEQQKKVIASGC
jgi:hypothetical protein